VLVAGVGDGAQARAPSARRDERLHERLWKTVWAGSGRSCGAFISLQHSELLVSKIYGIITIQRSFGNIMPQGGYEAG
jgi:hypothetical protein